MNELIGLVGYLLMADLPSVRKAAERAGIVQFVGTVSMQTRDTGTLAFLLVMITFNVNGRTCR